MLFFQFAFVFVFWPVVLGGDRALARRVGARNAWLLFASVLFYASTSLEFLPLLAGTIAIDHLAAKKIAAARDASTARRRWLLLSIASNLLALGVFKYCGFITGVLHTLSGGLVPHVELPLPVGISFYTFQSMSYTIDVYRDRARPAKSLGTFATFVVLFPQLIAGPIVRWTDVADELDVRRESPDRFGWGMMLFVAGMAKKIVLADTFAALAAPHLSAPAQLGFIDAWTAMILYAGQIYYDFSGYSDMAIGLGAMLGFTFPANFDSPYRAISFSDFWRRWHMTLSTWLRDYLYIPLGGNRGTAARTYVNLMVTMLLGGLWHGASWSFVVWGAAHGALLAMERALGDANPLHNLPLALRRAFVLAAVTWIWVPFRLDDQAGTLATWRAMSGLAGGGALDPRALAGAVAVLVTVWWPTNTGHWKPIFDARRLTFAVAALVVSVFLAYGRLELSPFLYFRF